MHFITNNKYPFFVIHSFSCIVGCKNRFGNHAKYSLLQIIVVMNTGKLDILLFLSEHKELGN